MTHEDALTVKGLLHNSYDTSLDNCYSDTDWFVRLHRKDRSFQIKSSTGLFFSIVEVGIGEHNIGWKRLASCLSFIQIPAYIKNL